MLVDGPERRGAPAVGVDDGVVAERLDEDGAAGRLQNPSDLAIRAREIEVVDHPRATDQIERAVRKVQGLGVHHQELDAVLELLFGRPATPLLHRHR